MSTHRVLFALLSVGLLAGCSGGASEDAGSADIAKVSQVKSTFGPEFQITEKSSGIDPKMLESPKLPDGLKFDPADCAAFATEETLPDDLKGNMSSVIAEGEGNRFVVIAMQTSQEVPVKDPGEKCKKVSFSTGTMRGTIEAVPAPEIEGVQTFGVHRVLEANINGKSQTGEVYSYLAHFGDHQVIVTANPLVTADKPVAPVDTKRAEALLTDAVNAIRS
ncbi:DUF5642 family protein [Mycolicibacterium confluentis]|uniref:Uncharacterized protein n=1 Tax=Mycolicibacterium confluentis TaxID=28047 RepID=A0A7I7XRX2_9MYCO|nr:DUF5642 family protein [Mycolicibacterium confluentis]MCV7318818.1 DUF5642 family protein [Mycolicibacterium confluentis]ORV23070.1 hypothetical protein AWB99_24420 [Mycolicibacterium confluentis]BBZ31970.1 hypothetical protein MCNF_05750 [Mycolicibacterium confluentis]